MTRPILRGNVDATGTQRRIRALVVLGWTMQDLADQCSDVMSRRTLSAIASGTRLTCTIATRRIVAQLYEEMSTLPPFETISRQRALNRGWLGPERWTGLEMDDPWVTPWPEARPRPDVVAAIVARQAPPEVPTRAEREAAAWSLLDTHGARQIGRITGVPEVLAVRWRADWLKRNRRSSTP